MNDKTFEELLSENRIVTERYINFRIGNSFDADEVIQETYLGAYSSFHTLRDHSLFKPWILSIARNKCNLWFRQKGKYTYISLDVLGDYTGELDVDYDDTLEGAMGSIPDEFSEVLQLTFDGYRQNEISEKMGIPVGTVKSRLHKAKRLLRAALLPKENSIEKKGKSIMVRDSYLGIFPTELPEISIKKKDTPFFEVRFEEQSFIIPRIGNKNSEATYRYPHRKLTLISTCYVPKAAYVHGVCGVKVCRDTYNVKADKLYKNEGVWYTQLTDEYIRGLASVNCESDDEYPTEIYTFLEEDYDISVNDGDRVRGIPVLVKENPPVILENGDIIAVGDSRRFTMGVYDVTVGNKKFECIKILYLSGYCITEDYVDRNGRIVLMKWYERDESIAVNDNYTDEYRKSIKDNPTITVNGEVYRLIEDRIGEYAMG